MKRKLIWAGIVLLVICLISDRQGTVDFLTEVFGIIAVGWICLKLIEIISRNNDKKQREEFERTQYLKLHPHEAALINLTNQVNDLNDQLDVLNKNSKQKKSLLLSGLVGWWIGRKIF